MLQQEEKDTLDSLPFENTPQSLAIPMTETEEGLYVGTWTVPEGLAVTDLQVQVIFVDQYGYEVSAIADGRVTVIANIEYMADNTMIVDDEAFELEYANRNSDVQSKMIEFPQ